LCEPYQQVMNYIKNPTAVIDKDNLIDQLKRVENGLELILSGRNESVDESIEPKKLLYQDKKMAENLKIYVSTILADAQREVVNRNR